MNVLLTGGLGYIGSHASVALLNAGHRVVIIDNLSNSSEAVLEKCQQITARRIPFVKGDVCDSGLVAHVLAHYNIDAVIHFAGLKAVGESVEKPLSYYANNVLGAISLLKAMSLQEVRTLVFSSSATVYGQPQYLPLDESHPTCAANPYGRSKLYIEEMLKDIATAHPVWRIACLRYFNPVGAHESGLIGENPSGVPNNLMPYIARVAAGQLDRLNIFGGDYPTADGTGVRDYIHVMDLAEGHTAALAYLMHNNGWHAINLGTGSGYSVLDMVHAFEKSSGRRVPYNIVDRRAGDVAACYADTSKATTAMRWRSSRTLDDMCASTWRFQQLHNASVRS